MSRFTVMFSLALILVACATSSATPTASPVPATPTPSAAPTASATATLTPSTTPVPSATPTPTLRPTPTPIPSTSPSPSAVPDTPTASARPEDLWLGTDDVRLHPDGELFYSGDRISVEVVAHHGYDWHASDRDVPDVELEIWAGEPETGTLIAENRIRFYGRSEGEAHLEWVWDTTGLTGTQTLNVLLDPDDEIQIGDEDPNNNRVTRSIELLPQAELPDAWADARWVTTTSACCVFHYMTHTAAERDIAALTALADEAIVYAGRQLDEALEDVTLDVYLIDRVLGHGGFAGEVIILSYLDRFYAGGAWEQVFRHEGVHVLDRRFAEVRTPLLSEGLAVYIAGGHFREEPLTERAAALLALDCPAGSPDGGYDPDECTGERYIPLPELADDFYPSQHEIGYLEAGAFVKFLVDRFGWQAFKAFYGDIPEIKGGAAARIDRALQEHFDLTLSQAEAEWLETLQALPTPTAQIADLRLTVEFYDTLRRYQQAWDPSAYFLEVWLPSPQEAEERGITADFRRHPERRVNVTLETMFFATDRAIDVAAYDRAEALLFAINAVLDAEGDLEAHPLAVEYQTLVEATADAGYEAQQVEIRADGTARVLAARGEGAVTVELAFAQRAGTWVLLSTN